MGGLIKEKEMRFLKWTGAYSAKNVQFVTVAVPKVYLERNTSREANRSSAGQNIFII